ncbi:MAG: AAA family ATPase [Bacilli bacterium]|nr:AAA family ATPase [Bacilli bacterium]
MDYKGLKICKILEPTFMEDNKVFKVNDVCLGYETNNNIVIVSGDYAGNIYPNIKKSDLKNIDENSYYGWTENINNLKIVFGTNDIIELKDNLETVAIDKMYYIDYEKGVIEPYSFEMPDIFDEEIFEKEEEIKEEENEENYTLPSIKEISLKIKEKIISQDMAINQVLAAIYGNRQIIENKNLTKEEKRNLKKSVLIYGNTGTGKTEISKQIASFLNLPIQIEDATKYTAEGYQGSSVNEMLIHLYRKCNGDLKKAENAILVIDEIDKKKDNKTSYTSSTTDVLYSLLKIIEGETFILQIGEDRKLIEFDTSNLTIALSGRFEGVDKVKEDRKSIGFNISSLEKEENPKVAQAENFVKLGIPGEFIGRNSCIVRTNDLSVEDLKLIITSSSLSALLLKKKFYELNNVSLTYDDDFITFLAEEAYKSGIGARGIKQALENVIKDLEFEILSGDIKEIKLTRNGVIKKYNNDKKLVRKQELNI